jgi:hypothetical protein
MTYECESEQTKICNEKPRYYETKNDWDGNNLYSKIRYLSEFETFKDQKKIVLSRTFSDKGMLLKELEFNKDSSLLQDNYYKYDRDCRIIWSKENTRNKNTYTISKIQYDTLGYSSILHTFGTMFNDSIKFSNYQKYDEYDNIVKDSLVKGELDEVTKYKNKYDSKKNLIEIITVRKDTGVIEKVNASYNEKGKIKTISTNEYLYSTFTDLVWRNEILFEENYHVITESKDTILEKSILYNELFNPIKVTSYENKSVSEIIEYAYEYDDRCNWISQQSIITYPKLRKKITQIDRQIKYWQ